MLYNENIILENDFVMLRPLQNEDIKHLISFVKNEPEIWKYSLMQVSTIADLEKYIIDAIANRNQKKEYPFIVFDKIKNQYAGSTRFYDIQLQYLSLQLGYTWYGKAFQGTYVNKNCKYLLLEYAFEKLGIERVEFRADYRNERSIAAMERIGCVKEGVFRNHLPTVEGGRRSSIILSILKEEWHKTVKSNLYSKIKNEKK